MTMENREGKEHLKGKKKRKKREIEIQVKFYDFFPEKEFICIVG